jgi:amino acid permease
MSVPIIALSFVYQNVVPVLCTDLEGDLPRVRTAIVLGTAIPLGLFLVWDAVILGSFPVDTGVAVEKMVDPLQQLRSSSVTVGVSLVVLAYLINSHQSPANQSSFDHTAVCGSILSFCNRNILYRVCLRPL